MTFINLFDCRKKSSNQQKSKCTEVEQMNCNYHRSYYQFCVWPSKQTHETVICMKVKCPLQPWLKTFCLNHSGASVTASISCMVFEAKFLFFSAIKLNPGKHLFFLLMWLTVGSSSDWTPTAIGKDVTRIFILWMHVLPVVWQAVLCYPCLYRICFQACLTLASCHQINPFQLSTSSMPALRDLY